MTGLLEGAAAQGRGVSRAVNAENRIGGKGIGGMAAGVLGPSRKGSPCLRNIAPGESVVLGDMEGPGIIRHIWMTVDGRTSEADRYVLRDLVLLMYWDEEEIPSVECPLGDFFCCGFGTDYLVNSMPVAVLPARGFNCYFQMPFGKRARIVLKNQHRNPIPEFFYQIDYCLMEELPEDMLYFHASWRRERMTRLGQDYVIADHIKGRGNYIGTFLALSTLERYWWGEGEVKFYLDGDRQYPTICGTGLEDYFGGSWSFARQEEGRTVETNYCTPFLGYPFYSAHDRDVHNAYHNDECPPMRAFYRWHLPDPVMFEKDLKVTVQQIGTCAGGLFERQDDVSSVAYWYQTEPHQAFPALPEARERWPR